MVLLSVGLWWRFMVGPYMLLISRSPSSAPYVLAGTGAAIVLFGLFGCFATCRGRPWMLHLVRSQPEGPLCSDWKHVHVTFDLSTVRRLSVAGFLDRAHRWNLRLRVSSRGKTSDPDRCRVSSRLTVTSRLCPDQRDVPDDVRRGGEELRWAP